MSKQLLILDLDETLIYAAETPIADLAVDFRVGAYSVYRRPFLGEFLAAVSTWFDLAVWSSASGPYVQGIVANVFGDAHALRFVWSRERCTLRYDSESQRYCHAKNLAKLRKRGYRLERILIVDDSPDKVARNYGNHLRVRPFSGDQADTELRDLLPFLDRLRSVENVRTIEKRHWRSVAAAERKADEARRP